VVAAGGGSLFVLAGVNGAGKSSIGGARLRADGMESFDPDEVARNLQAEEGLDLQTAQEEAWNLGRDLLVRTIDEQGNFAFETTLGAKTMAGLIHKAVDHGLEVTIWYAGLDTVELHIERVRARVAAGGHDIPEHKIRERFAKSHENLAALAPRVAELRVYDNSREASPELGERPSPRLLLHRLDGVVVEHVPPGEAPHWVLPTFVAVGIDVSAAGPLSVRRLEDLCEGLTAEERSKLRWSPRGIRDVLAQLLAEPSDEAIVQATELVRAATVDLAPVLSQRLYHLDALRSGIEAVWRSDVALLRSTLASDAADAAEWALSVWLGLVQVSLAATAHGSLATAALSPIDVKRSSVEASLLRLQTLLFAVLEGARTAAEASHVARLAFLSREAAEVLQKALQSLRFDDLPPAQNDTTSGDSSGST
jgi:predicted ABC-type ATPase